MRWLATCAAAAPTNASATLSSVQRPLFEGGTTMNAPDMNLSRLHLLQAGAAALVVGFSAEASLASTAAPALEPARGVAKDVVDSFLVMHTDGKIMHDAQRHPGAQRL